MCRFSVFISLTVKNKWRYFLINIIIFIKNCHSVSTSYLNNIFRFIRLRNLNNCKFGASFQPVNRRLCKWRQTLLPQPLEWAESVIRYNLQIFVKRSWQSKFFSTSTDRVYARKFEIMTDFMFVNNAAFTIYNCYKSFVVRREVGPRKVPTRN